MEQDRDGGSTQRILGHFNIQTLPPPHPYTTYLSTNIRIHKQYNPPSQLLKITDVLFSINIFQNPFEQTRQHTTTMVNNTLQTLKDKITETTFLWVPATPTHQIPENVTADRGANYAGGLALKLKCFFVVC